MAEHFAYKTYCWTLGTTSFRMSDFHKNIEQQLLYLYKFWQINQNLEWSNSKTQEKYYDFLLHNGFVFGEIEKFPLKKAKTARQKTSGLVDIGLIYPNRKLTEVGYSLLKMTEKNNFKIDNQFNIPSDSFLYFKQLLKTVQYDDNISVRPYLLVAKLLLSCNSYLTYEELTYLAPLCINAAVTNKILKEIASLRSGNTTIDNIIINTVISSYNYPLALYYFLASKKTLNDFYIVGMNRKSPKYDAPYYNLYHSMKDVIFLKNKSMFSVLMDSLNLLSGKTKIMWKSFLFKSTKQIMRFEDLQIDNFSAVNDEDEFATIFLNICTYLR